MPNQVEPPVLLSRLMGFVLATSLVVLGVLGYTLWHLFPLSRPQVFFLTTQIKPEMDVGLYFMPLRDDDENTTRYIKSFVKEYIKARNEVFDDIDAMQQKWGTSDDGIVNAWSVPAVYNAFAQTNRVERMMYQGARVTQTCTVDFASGPESVAPRYARDNKRWRAEFNYTCTNSNGQTTSKDYTIALDIMLDEKHGMEKFKYGDRIKNPLGIRVSRYSVDNGGTDPLDSK